MSDAVKILFGIVVLILAALIALYVWWEKRHDRLVPAGAPRDDVEPAEPESPPAVEPVSVG